MGAESWVADTPWTDERVAALKRLWADGLTASQIAREIGGLSHYGDGGRSAVCGKLSRLGLGRSDRDPSKFRPGPRKMSSAASRPAPHHNKRNGDAFKVLHRIRRNAAEARAGAVAEAVDDVAPVVRRLSVLDLRAGECRWPHGDPGTPGFGFCGAPVAFEESSYCGHHRGIAYQKAPLRPVSTWRTWL